MLGETGIWVVGPINGSGDFLAYGSPSISAVVVTMTETAADERLGSHADHAGLRDDGT